MTSTPSGIHLIELRPGHLTEHGRSLIDWEQLQFELRHAAHADRGMPPIAGASGTFSNYLQTKTLGHLTGQDNASWATITSFLALCTTVPDSSKTGSTIVEANYTGYARASVPFGSWGAPASGGAGGQSTITNSAQITFANATAGSSVVVGWALCDALTVGNMVAWGSATSVTINQTQTPAQVAAGGLTIGLT